MQLLEVNEKLTNASFAFFSPDISVKEYCAGIRNRWNRYAFKWEQYSDKDRIELAIAQYEYEQGIKEIRQNPTRFPTKRDWSKRNNVITCWELSPIQAIEFVLEDARIAHQAQLSQAQSLHRWREADEIRHWIPSKELIGEIIGYQEQLQQLSPADEQHRYLTEIVGAISVTIDALM